MNKKLLIVLGLILVGLLGIGGYVIAKRGTRTASTESTSSSAGATLSGSCKYDDADLCKFIRSWKDNKYFTVTSNATMSGKTYTTVFKSVGDDRTQMISSESGKENYNVINIGNTTFTKDYTDGKWTKTTVESTTMAEFESDYDFDVKAEQAEDKTTYKKIGTEACGSLTCFKYQVINPDTSNSTDYIYFDTKQYQLRKMRSEGKDGTVSESTFDYAAITISEPSPIKEASARSQATMPTEAELKALQDAINNASVDMSADSSASVE